MDRQSAVESQVRPSPALLVRTRQAPFDGNDFPSGIANNRLNFATVYFWTGTLSASTQNLFHRAAVSAVGQSS
jgi:hypothetical protein